MSFITFSDDPESNIVQYNNLSPSNCLREATISALLDPAKQYADDLCTSISISDCSNALYASTSKTGESESGLVIKSLADVAKACRAIDASSLLKRVRTPFGKPRNYNIDRDNRMSTMLG